MKDPAPDFEKIKYSHPELKFEGSYKKECYASPMAY